MNYLCAIWDKSKNDTKNGFYYFIILTLKNWDYYNVDRGCSGLLILAHYMRTLAQIILIVNLEKFELVDLMKHV